VYCRERAEVDVGGYEDDVDHREHCGDHGDPHLQLHDELKTEDSADHDEEGHQDKCCHLGKEAAVPTQPGEDGRCGQYRE
jgi:hypothetical protein